MAEPARNLCRHLLVATEPTLPKTINGCRHTSATIQLERGVKLPDAEGCLIAGGDETFVATGQRLLHQFATIGALHVIPAPGSSEFQTFHYGIGSIQLESIRIGFAIEIGDANLCRRTIVIYDSLLAEVGVVVLGIKLQRLAKQGNIERTADT